MSSSISSVNQSTRRNRVAIKLLAIFLVCAAPLVGSYVAYRYWRPGAFMNYGELLPVTPVPDSRLTTSDGAAFRLSMLRGKWILLHADSGDCRTDPCVRKLYDMRQSRLAQGNNMDRLERVWLVTDDAPPSAPQPELYEGMYVLRGDVAIPLAALPAAGDVRDHIYLVDPAGNVMMRYPKDADPKRMIRDLTRLLKYSQAG